MVSRLSTILALVSLGLAGSQDSCKCVSVTLPEREHKLFLNGEQVLTLSRQTPGDQCWPSTSTWNSLNTTVAGKLIRNLPIAISCYPGPYHNKGECAHIYSQWHNSAFQELSPVGYCYPTDEPCPPVDLRREIPGTCTLGPAPVYTINATEPTELAAGMAFAQKHNIRLVVRNTGHDILGKCVVYLAHV
jgi:hypothetical protein